MVNLRVYDQAGDPYYIDLYDTEPIKLNFSIEDITNTETKSTFSRVFRVPSTAKNNEFFENAFLVEGIDYDVTVKVPAEIEVGGAIFRTGHIRLQNIYVNKEQDRIDYELLYLGETRDFSSTIGEKTLCELDGSSLIHELSYTNIVNSWNAFPQGTSGNTGLKFGNVLYPLVDHGNTYDGNGVAQESQIRTTGSNRFTQNAHPLELNRFKPMIRAKKIIDLIFAQTPYTYSSSFLNSFFFGKIYVSAWGNDAGVTVQTDQSEQLMQATIPGIFGYNGQLNQLMWLNQENYDPGNNFNNQPFPSPGFSYTAPLTGIYDFTGSGYIIAVPYPSTGAGFGCLEIWVNGALAETGTCTSQGTASVNATLSLTAGDYVQLYVTWSNNIDFGSLITDATLTCTAAPGDLDPTFLLDCEYKQMDYLRDILKIFRCVMAPDKDNPNNFIIEPWVNYVTTGQIYDWTSKVDRTKDFQIEPIFYTQTDEINFLFSEDEDWLNMYNQDAYKQVYGQLKFDSGNELLTDSRDITVGFAPTPTTQVEGQTNTSAFIIPQPHTHDSEGGQTVHLPIKPVTRILFYNGLKTTGGVTWHLTDGVTTYARTNYPQVSYQEGAPPAGSGLNLNWDRWFAYYGTNVSGYNGLTGQSLFERYWSGYIGSLYNKFARRVTCHVILNSVDLQEFSFDDVIFIDGVYYIPEKIIDAPVGSLEPVKVQLIKLLDYVPPSPSNPPQTFYYYQVQETDCDALTGPIFVMQSAVPLQLGDYVWAQGLTTCFQVISQSTSTVWQLVYQSSYVSCETCAGGGTAQTVYRVEQYTSTCPNTISPGISVATVGTLSVGDTVALTSTPGCWRIVGPSANPPVDTILQVYIDCDACVDEVGPESTYLVQTCLAPFAQTVVQSGTALAIGQSITIQGAQGCWEVIDYSNDAPMEYVQDIYNNCTQCLESNDIEYSYDLTKCDNSATTIASYSSSLVPGQVVRINSLPGCWVVDGPSPNPPFTNIISLFSSCATCNTLVPIDQGEIL